MNFQALPVQEVSDLLSHHILFCFFSASVHTVVKIWSDVSILFSGRSFPLEREEVQTLRSAISSRTRAVDGFSPNPILGVSSLSTLPSVLTTLCTT